MKKKRISCCEVLEARIIELEGKRQHGAEACHQAWSRIRELEAENAQLIEKCAHICEENKRALGSADQFYTDPDQQRVALAKEMLDASACAIRALK